MISHTSPRTRKCSIMTKQNKANPTCYKSGNEIVHTFSRSSTSFCLCLSACSYISFVSSSSFLNVCILSFRAFKGPAEAGFLTEFICAILSRLIQKWPSQKTGRGPMYFRWNYIPPLLLLNPPIHKILFSPVCFNSLGSNVDTVRIDKYLQTPVLCPSYFSATWNKSNFSDDRQYFWQTDGQGQPQSCDQF